jgi:hypothetical protein
MPQVRDEGVDRETLTAETWAQALPSIGEFNYLGATNTRPDGMFEAAFPLPVLTPATGSLLSNNEATARAADVLPAASPSDRAFSAIAIDPVGNTSEMSVRRRAD